MNKRTPFLLAAAVFGLNKALCHEVLDDVVHLVDAVVESPQVRPVVHATDHTAQQLTLLQYNDVKLKSLSVSGREPNPAQCPGYFHVENY